MRVLGIDPGSHITGYGLVEKRRSGLVSIRHGEIIPPKNAPLSVCLRTIFDQILDVIREARPDVMAIEDIFYGKNIKSLIRQGEVRGVALLAGTSMSIPIFAYSPLEIKKAVVGYGRAEKSQVQQMVKAILGLPEVAPADASDALAIAICHAHFRKEQAI